MIQLNLLPHHNFPTKFGRTTDKVLHSSNTDIGHHIKENYMQISLEYL